MIDLEAVQSPGSRQRGIGRYSMSLAKAMLRQGRGHEFIVALNGMYEGTAAGVREELAGLVPAANIVSWHSTLPPLEAHGDAGLRRAQQRVRSAFFASLHADFVHVASPFESGAYAFATIGPGRGDHRTAVTLYDLIPHIYPEYYQRPAEVGRAYNDRLDNLRRADLWLAISEASRREGIEQLGLPPDRVVNISSAVDGHFVPGTVPPEHEAALRVHYGLWQPFVMYTGGIDHRKNIEGLIGAWAMLPPEIRRTHQLAIVCSVPPHDRARLEELARNHGVAPWELVLTGFVPEAHLVDLYRICRLFVFPSIHEGFGLPALEAMSCGAPVIGADNSSIPEVIGRADALFDARSRDSMAAKLQQCLVDDAFRNELAQHGPGRAKRFSWDHSAGVALDAIEAAGPPARAARRAPPARLRLAFVSPLPPQRSGIADYSAELLPALAGHYDIDVIVEQPELDPAVARCARAVRDPGWLLAHAGEYDRVLYHFGNSEFHEYMVPLLEKLGGTVVLHDFFLSGMQANRELVTEKQPHWSRALYASHGWSALLERLHAPDMWPVIHGYPANFDVLRNADGIIVHSPHSKNLARDWYGPRADRGWEVVPLMRQPLAPRREQARRELGLAHDDFLVCSFGMLGRTKMSDRVLGAWAASSLAGDPHARLVFVGQNDVGGYGDNMESLIASSGPRVAITGWADPETFRRYLDAADLAVQLRTLSRGETSAAVLDAMNHGVPVIANANGSMAFLPRDAVLLLPDEFDDVQLVHALEELRADAGRRAAMGERGRRVIEEQHSPHASAAAYVDAMEYFAQEAALRARAVARDVAGEFSTPCAPDVAQALASAIAHDLPDPAPARQLLIDVSGQVSAQTPPDPLVIGLARTWYPGWRAEPVYLDAEGRMRYARRLMLKLAGAAQDLLEDELVELRPEDVWCNVGDHAEPPAVVIETGNACITLAADIDADAEFVWPWLAATQRRHDAPRLLVDISELVRYDWKSGIQRVVKNDLLELLRRPPAGYVVVPVYTKAGQFGYTVANRYLRDAARLPGASDEVIDNPVEPGPGDLFFGLDLQPHLVVAHESWFETLRARGGKFAFMLYDLLPIQLPECFAPGAAPDHERWLRVIAKSDLVICISQAVEQTFNAWLAQHGLEAAAVTHVHLGADIGSRIASQGVPAESEALLERLRSQPAFLMVGTLEPRKAYPPVIDSFEVLWSQGRDCVLVIVGKLGWMTDDLVARLRAHPEAGRRLVWLESASDEFLEALYRACSALILASRGEGFGLPLIEAAQRGLPLIARDLPVFREVAGDHAFYFSDDSPQALAGAIAAWLEMRTAGTIPRPDGMRWLTWRESAARVRRELEALYAV